MIESNSTPALLSTLIIALLFFLLISYLANKIQQLEIKNMMKDDEIKRLNNEIIKIKNNQKTIDFMKGDQ